MEELTIILALLMFFATVIYVYFTGQLLKETIALRKVETNPFIGANIQIREGFSFIIIKNIGKAPAYSLNINLEENIFEEIKATISAINYTQINYFGVNQEISIPFDTRKFVDLKKMIEVDLRYQSKDKENFSEIISLGLEPYNNLGTFYPKSEYEDIFKNIKKELENIGKFTKNIK